jgi:hypothetical protein
VAEEILLVHALVGTASLEPIGPVGAEQQQGDGAMVGLHAGRQQLGHRRSGGGDHGGGQASGPGEPKGEEGGRTLIEGGVQAKSPALQQARRNREGSRTAARAEHGVHQAGPQERS